jgi:hypothetical protein
MADRERTLWVALTTPPRSSSTSWATMFLYMVGITTAIFVFWPWVVETAKVVKQMLLP